MSNRRDPYSSFGKEVFMRILSALGLTATLGLLVCGMASSATEHVPSIVFQPTRFSAPGVYAGAPDLPLTLSMIEAGGGPKDFDSVKLIHVLAGNLTNAEVAKLTKEFGADKVHSFLTTFNFVVADSLRLVTKAGVVLPKTPKPSPSNGKALSAALWAAGQSGKGFNVEVMLDRLVSHPIHVQVMKDIDAKYGIAADATYHAVLRAAMQDLASAYQVK